MLQTKKPRNKPCQKDYLNNMNQLSSYSIVFIVIIIIIIIIINVSYYIMELVYTYCCLSFVEV